MIKRLLIRFLMSRLRAIGPALGRADARYHRQLGSLYGRQYNLFARLTRMGADKAEIKKALARNAVDNSTKFLGAGLPIVARQIIHHGGPECGYDYQFSTIDARSREPIPAIGDVFDVQIGEGLAVPYMRVGNDNTEGVGAAGCSDQQIDRRPWPYDIRFRAVRLMPLEGGEEGA